MDQQIGEIAGKVWNYLSKKEEASVTEVCRTLEEPQSKVNMAIGWLAREDKLKFVSKNRGNALRLK